jgi:ribosomal protein S27E
MPIEGFGSHPDEGRRIHQTPASRDMVTDIFTTDSVPENQETIPFRHQSSFLPVECPHCENEIEEIRGVLLDNGIGVGLCNSCSRILGQF